jgi:hypothetical protein
MRVSTGSTVFEGLPRGTVVTVRGRWPQPVIIDGQCIFLSAAPIEFVRQGGRDTQVYHILPIRRLIRRV